MCTFVVEVDAAVDAAAAAAATANMPPLLSRFMGIDIGSLKAT